MKTYLSLQRNIVSINHIIFGRRHFSENLDVFFNKFFLTYEVLHPSTACTESFQLQNIPNESWGVIVK